MNRNNRSLFFLVLLITASTAVAQQKKTAAPVKEYTIEQFMNVTGVRGAGFSADESRLLFSSNRTGIWNAYSIAVGGGEWTPITASTVDSTYAVSYFPSDDRVVFTRDRAKHHLLERPRDNPRRTGFITAVVVWVATVFAFGASDRIFLALQISYTLQLWVFRVLFFVGPVVAYVVARRWAEDLRRGGEHPLRGIQADVVLPPRQPADARAGTDAARGEG